MVWGAIAAAAIGGLASAYGASKQNQANQAASREQMAFQERMSSTSYQRGMADMRLAGLNPILAYKMGGATTPTGASYQAQNVAGAGVSSARSSYATIANTANVQATTRNQQMRNADYEMFGDSLTGRNAASAWRMLKSAGGKRPNEKSRTDKAVYGRARPWREGRKGAKVKRKLLPPTLSRKQARKKWGNRPGFGEMGRAYRGYNPRPKRAPIF